MESAGSLDEVNTGPTNSGGAKTSGIDVSVDWRARVLGGSFNLHGAYTHLISGYTIPLPGSPRDNFAGELAADNTINAPRDKFSVSAGYDIDGIGFTMTGTWIGGVTLDDQLIAGDTPVSGTNDPSNPLYRIRSQFYLDSQIRFRTGDNFEFYVGAKNLLNNKPPFLADIGGTTGQDTDTSTYDPLGRRFYVGFRKKF